MKYTTPTDSAEARTRTMLWAIVAIGTALRLYGLAARSIWYDEGCMLGLAAKVDWSFRFYRADVTSDAPLLAILAHVVQWLLYATLGLGPGSTAYDYVLRLIPCTFAILAVPLTYLACRALFNNRPAALGAAFLCAISPFQIYYASEIKPYSLYLAASLAALYFLLKALEEDRPRDWIGLIITLAAPMYAHYFSIWNIFLFNVYFLIALSRYRRLFWKWVAVQCVLLVMILPALLMAFRVAKFFEGIQNVYTLRPGFATGFITFKTFFAGYSPNSTAYWALFLAGLAVFLVGLFRLRERRHILVLCLLLTVVPIAANVAIWRLRHFPMYEHRLFIFSGAIVYGIAALGIGALPRRWLRLVAFAVMAGLTLPCLADHYAYRLHPSIAHRMGVRYKVQNREAAAYIAENLRDGDVVVHASHFTYFPFLYYFECVPAKQCTIRLTRDELTGFLETYPNQALWERYGAMPVRLETATQDARRVWYVESFWEPFDLPDHVKLMRAWLDGHFVYKDCRELDGVTVYLYDCDPAAALEGVRERLADDGDWGVQSKPEPADAPLAFTVTITNHGGIRRDLDGRIYGSARAVDANQFTSTKLDAGAWSLWYQYIEGRAPNHTNALAMVAHLSSLTGDSDSIYKDLALAPGEYSAFVWCIEATDPENRSRAAIGLAKLPIAGDPNAAEPIGMVNSNNPAGPPGWTWRKAGTLRSDGTPFRLLVSATNPDRLPEAYFDLGRVLFVDTSVMTDPALDIQRFHVTLNPGESHTFAIPAPEIPDGNIRTDVEVVDAQHRDVRNIFFTTRAVSAIPR